MSMYHYLKIGNGFFESFRSEVFPPQSVTMDVELKNDDDAIFAGDRYREIYCYYNGFVDTQTGVLCCGWEKIKPRGGAT